MTGWKGQSQAPRTQVELLPRLLSSSLLEWNKEYPTPLGAGQLLGSSKYLTQFQLQPNSNL